MSNTTDVLTALYSVATLTSIPSNQRAALLAAARIIRDAEAAGLVTADGVIVWVGDQVWHPDHDVGACVESHKGSAMADFPEYRDGRVVGWSGYGVDACYSTPEAAEAAKAKGDAQ